ncbi:MAG: hypothetical protein J5994_10205 [Ruminococcus sp.]|nr:hypothetical protein [Ruminococcus sp.]
MTIDEFVQLIDRSGDIMLTCGKYKLTIITWADEGIGIGFQNKNPALNKIQYFSSSTELVNKFLLDGIPLAKLSDKIIIDQCT